MASPTQIAIPIAVGAISVFAFRRYIAGGVCNDKVDLTGQAIIITGSSGGLGLENALMLAAMNAHIIIAARDEKKGRLVVERVKRETNNENIEFMHLDLTDLDSIRSFAQAFKAKKLKLKVLLNNAGTAPTGERTKQGFELAMGVNHLGHFLLTNLLLDDIIEAKGRVVTVSSRMAFRGNIPWDDFNYRNHSVATAYSDSKLANVMFTAELQRRLEGTGAEAFSVHPGFIMTDIFRHEGSFGQFVLSAIAFLLGKTPRQGAQTSLFACISPSINGKGGSYLADCGVASMPSAAKDVNKTKQLWDLSSELVGLDVKKSA
eukprot:TRINITY_DN4967_c0_g1_i5.p1 TRINITY_DN4967_c0_g1~~TRINITY_DN4967_c0_g1_i5.p1  ORF type:complete len:318 (-),score=43.52 TRINITY_DN4967_c0_g1_i5:589-1542(-)